jgi:hypothetical protein
MIWSDEPVRLAYVMALLVLVWPLAMSLVRRRPR